MKSGTPWLIAVFSGAAVATAIGAVALLGTRAYPLPAALSPSGILFAVAALSASLAVAAVVQARGIRSDRQTASKLSADVIGVVLDRRTAEQIANARRAPLVDLPGRASLSIAKSGISVFDRRGEVLLTFPMDEIESVEPSSTPGVGTRFAAIGLNLRGGRVDLTLAGRGLAGMNQPTKGEMDHIVERIRSGKRRWSV